MGVQEHLLAHRSRQAPLAAVVDEPIDIVERESRDLQACANRSRGQVVSGRQPGKNAGPRPRDLHRRRGPLGGLGGRSRPGQDQGRHARVGQGRSPDRFLSTLVDLGGTEVGPVLRVEVSPPPEPVGLLPDLATIRDRTRASTALGDASRVVHARSRVFGWLSLGWNGSYTTWREYEIVYLLLAGLATPLVLSVHSIVSMDFSSIRVGSGLVVRWKKSWAT